MATKYSDCNYAQLIDNDFTCIITGEKCKWGIPIESECFTAAKFNNKDRRKNNHAKSSDE